MNFFKSLLSLFLLSSSFACSSNEDFRTDVYFTEEDLPNPIQLQGKKYNIPEIINPRGLMLKDQYAVVFERKSIESNKIHVIDLKTGKYLRSKGKDGMGPGEVTVITQIEDVGEEGMVWTYDPEMRIFSKFDLSDSSLLAVDQIKSPETSYFLTSTTWTGTKSILGNSVDGWTKYLHLNIDGDTLALFGSWQDMIANRELPRGIKPDELDANFVSSLFQGVLKTSKDGKKAVMAGISIDYIDVVDLNDNSILTIYGPSQEIQDFRIGHWDGFQVPDLASNSTERYLDVYPGEKSFFALFFGKPYRELGSPESLNRVFEFDYNGNILNQYQLDYPVYGIAVDEENKAIYSVTVDREPNLVRFDY
ncbi:TolB-like 6-bladed beta-propeller domain-containing protein [Algoriphagus halophytocola]|uniref:TolB-like 6-bladed beta-propeller domain-containing protein n=1 Tax=Algoriphagus halophytocola TaxID=2991499 RepID=A0ABY6MHD9_9BACT|nr:MULTISPECIES: TolB-like 6-bladed beta-propeller domain-containing protein [unclassified Algoriphagus]UZD22081.1 TolB-like 6-bladed beta-propeller domain-containing protein [Algoriphagus sp. TR-M5]WBL43332.1 TolB-like 6-bladed beta-propeller domain-containing protein [Algoriphagus sp. TR-M9]